MRRMGIDEAGRGCVLGALYIGAFIADEGLSDEALRAAGADDSKRLSQKKRLKIREALLPLGYGDVRSVSAEQIDTGNLNTLEEEVIVALVRKWRPDEVYVDALGHPATLPKVLARLSRQVAPLTPKWVMEPKADSTYPIVGAASILAKTKRDEALDALREQYGAIGSGYPSDPSTKRWLESWSRAGKEWPAFVRTRWGTITELSQRALFPGGGG
jgi:ribonuclease HII